MARCQIGKNSVARINAQTGEGGTHANRSQAFTVRTKDQKRNACRGERQRKAIEMGGW